MIDEHPDKGDSTIDKWTAVVVAATIAMFAALFVYLLT